jgi:hypothetical protein
MFFVTGLKAEKVFLFVDGNMQYIYTYIYVYICIYIYVYQQRNCNAMTFNSVVIF